MAKTYDSKSYELAEYFLQDEPTLNDEGHRKLLAMDIQNVIEDFIAIEKAD